jgi:hypothetical protein
VGDAHSCRESLLEVAHLETAVTAFIEAMSGEHPTAAEHLLDLRKLFGPHYLESRNLVLTSLSRTT